MRIVVDAGHGGVDPGAVGNGLSEEDLNLDVALRVAELLEAYGFDALLTRDEDEDISLQDRCDMANEADADAFVCIHFDASDKSTANGATVFCYTEASPKAEALADAVHESMYALFANGMRDRGIQTANFKVLRSTAMPAILIEGGFVSNPNEAVKIGSDEYLDSLAACIAEGVRSWASSNS